VGAIPQCRTVYPARRRTARSKEFPHGHCDGLTPHFLALLSPHSPVFLRSTERPNRWSRIRCALLGLLIRIRRFRSCDTPVERDVRHTMAMTLWPRRSGTLSETCGLGTSDAYIDAGYVFMRAHWEYPLSLEILVPAWRWWATRPGSWRRLSYRLFSNRSQNGRLGIYALLFQV